jgi:hypothetical protein
MLRRTLPRFLPARPRVLPTLSRCDSRCGTLGKDLLGPHGEGVLQKRGRGKQPERALCEKS